MSDNVKPIPRAELARARRIACRRAAATLIGVMAEGDASIDRIAKRLGKKPAAVRRALNLLIDGIDPDGKGLDWMADIAFAANAAVIVHLPPVKRTP